jgi:hypothetical protein
MKKNTGEKKTVVRDELNVKGGGLYAFLPFEKLDKNKKALFKIGIATKSINHRTEQYHTYFPNGVYIVAFFENPRIPMALRGKKEVTKKTHYINIENFVMNYVEENGGRVVHSTTRVKNPNDRNEGRTEWVYTDENIIHDAFTAAERKYGGILQTFHLKGINKTAEALEKANPTYVGEVIYNIPIN